MLVLSRELNETIELPELGISIEVLKIQKGRVSIGIKAPKLFRILRGELGERVGEVEESTSTDARPNLRK